MNKYLYRALLRRGGLKIVKELEKRDRIVERNEPCYSTQEAETAAPQVDRNKGCHPASGAIRSRDAFDASRLRSGNRGFIEREGKIFRTGAFNIRVMKA